MVSDPPSPQSAEHLLVNCAVNLTDMVSGQRDPSWAALTGRY